VQRTRVVREIMIHLSLYVFAFREAMDLAPQSV